MTLLESAAFLVFVACIGAYAFLILHVQKNGTSSPRSQVEKYRKSWLQKRLKNDEQIVIVQAIRNTIMSSSILASATLVAVPLLFGVIKVPAPLNSIPVIGSETFKLALLMGILLYTSVMILFHLRLLQRFTIMVGSDLRQIRTFESKDPIVVLSDMLNRAFREFANAMRALAYAVAVGIWFYSTHLFILATIVLTLAIAREDLLVD